MINRAKANWRLLIAIAELAGGEWPKQARDAAERISRTTRKPSFGVQLLAAMQGIFAGGRKEITSQEVVANLTADATGVWFEYKRGGPITQRQVADLLDQYDIHPVVVHPTKRKDVSRMGYKEKQFTEAFARYLPGDPNIQTSRPDRKAMKAKSLKARRK